jgi:hypothetical protein
MPAIHGVTHPFFPTGTSINNVYNLVNKISGKYTAMSKENRMSARQVLDGTVSLFMHETKEYIGLMVDFSATGIMLSSYMPLEIGTILEVDMVDIPPNIDSRRTGQVKAQVMWTDRITPSMYGNGCKVIELSDHAQLMLASYHPKNT